MAGQIRRKGDRKYLVRVFQGRDGQGKRHYVSETVHGTKRQAQERLNELLTKKSHGTLAVKTTETVGEYLGTWLETTARPSVRPRTLADYTRVIKTYIKPHLAEVRLSKLSPIDVRGMLVALRERGLSPRTVRMAHEVLRNALEQAVSDRLLRDNPARGRLVKKALPQKEAKALETVPAEDVGHFLEVASADRLGAYWTLLIMSGLRPSEALALRWEDVTGNVVSVTRALVDRAGPPHFQPPKSKKSRRAVVVPDVVVEALKGHRKRQAAERLAAGPAWQDGSQAFCPVTGQPFGDLVFCTETGEPLRQDHTRHRFKKIREAAELGDGITPYSLRHSCATLLVERGVPLKVVQERLGHSTYALTADTYSHVHQSMQQQAADALGEIVQ